MRRRANPQGPDSCEEFTDTILDVGTVEWLGDELVGTCFEEEILHAVVVDAGDDDDADIRQRILDQWQKFEAR